jgi:uncharacterized protein YdeI (YjbR/CyaY-like superfamily)
VRVLTEAGRIQPASSKPAWAFFEAQPPGYRKLVLRRIVSAKQQATRDKRFAALVAASAKGLRL